MNRDLHLSLNTLLRSAMTAYLDQPGGTWGLYGCYWDAPNATWTSLNGIEQALVADLRGRTDQDRTTIGQLRFAVERLTAAMPKDGYGTEVVGLRGIAVITVVDDDGRVCRAEALFDDGRLHIAIWRAAEPAPLWEVFEPDQAASVLRYRLAGPMLPGLLAALQGRSGEPAPAISEEQHRLSVELRGLLADRLADQRHAVFIIVAAVDGGWEFIPPSDLTERVQSKTSAGADMYTALRELADELEAEPLQAIPVLRGFGTVVHVQADNGDTIASLATYCEGTFHSAMWAHHQAAPDWAITPADTADRGLAEVIAVYTHLTDLLRGERR